MAIELKVPSVGESVVEVQIGRWHKAPGDAVAKDETLVEIETDKVTVELPAPLSGTLSRIIKPTGQTANVGDVIAQLEPAAAGQSVLASPSAHPAAEAPVSPAPPRAVEAPAATPPIAPPAKPHVTPEAARAMEPVAEPAPEAAPAVEPRPALERGEEIVPMTPMRRRIAQRLVEAQRNAALLTTFNELDLSSVIALRAELQESFQGRYQVKLGFMSFFVKASLHALKLVPQLNAEIRGNDIVYKHYYDIGVAIGGGKGLVVPVLRDADRMSFAEIERHIADLAQRARENKLDIEELAGGTFTITNGGIYGSMLSTPILNPPQSGILGMHAIQERPVARGGQVVIRPMMYVALTYDHRLVDGREAVTFLKHVKEVIEQPARILVEV